MRKYRHDAVALVGLLAASAGFSTPSRAETGQVAVVFTKGGFIVGVGGGEGVLVFRGQRYPFTVSGMSVGFTIGASTTKLVGRALNLRGPGSIEGTYPPRPTTRVHDHEGHDHDDHDHEASDDAEVAADEATAPAQAQA